MHHDIYDCIMSSNLDLSSKYYLVSGAFKRIGKQMVVSLSKDGTAGVALLARSSVSDTADEAPASVEESGCRPSSLLELKADMTDSRAGEKAARKIEADFGLLDVLVYNVG